MEPLAAAARGDFWKELEECWQHLCKWIDSDFWSFLSVRVSREKQAIFSPLSVFPQFPHVPSGTHSVKKVVMDEILIDICH